MFFFFKQKTAYEMRISDWSSDVCSSDLDLHDARHVGRIVQLDHPAVGHVDLIDHRGRRGDEIETELALQALLHDLQMQEPEEAAAEAEAEGGAGFRLVEDRKIAV